MGDSGEDSRGLCIAMYIGCNALGYPSTQERSSRVSLLGVLQRGNTGMDRREPLPLPTHFSLQLGLEPVFCFGGQPTCLPN